MKTNVTLKLDSDLLRQVRVAAAEEGESVSSLLARQLQEFIQRRKAYDLARRRALARLRKGFHLDWIRPGSREELHER